MGMGTNNIDPLIEYSIIFSKSGDGTLLPGKGGRLYAERNRALGD